MAEEIVIKTVLDLSGSEQKVKQEVTRALNSPEVQAQAKAAGRKIGESLSLGIETGRNRQSVEQKEIAHQRRIEAIHLQSAARIQQIETRKQAQIDVIRERGFQKEIEHQRKIERETQRSANALGSIRSAIVGIQGAFVALGAAGFISFFENLARKAIDAAVAIDRQINTLKALTGSAEQAKARFGELFALAQRTPGLTTGLATTLDVQLRILNVTQQTIDRILPQIGRLNAISPLGDPTRFVGNLTQLITQGFERQDLKELVGNSPFAGQLIKELFSVDSPTNAKAIRESAQRLGINTVEEFFTALAQAAENNPKLKAVTESLGTQFEKLQDRIQVALAPIGEELLKVILPAVNELVKILEQAAPQITAVLQENRREIIAVANAFVIAAGAVGQLIGEFRRLDQQFGIVRNIASVLLAITGNAGAIGPLRQALNNVDATRGETDSIAGLTGEQLRSRALGRADLHLLQIADRKLKEEEAERKRLARNSLRFTGGGGRARRTSGIDFLPLTADDLVTSQFEGEEELREIEKAKFRGRILRQQLTAAFEATEQKDRIAQGRLTRSALTADFERKEDLAEKAEKARKALEKTGELLSANERFARGFASSMITVGDAFERFGANVAFAFTNVRHLFEGLKQSVLGFFNDILGSALQSLVRQTIGPIFAGLGGGNLFRTPNFAGGGGGITVPSALSGPIGFGQGFGIGTGGGGAGGGAVAGAAGSILTGGRFSLGGLTRSIGVAGPLLGLSVGSSLGGRSRLGQVLGTAGGVLGGTLAGVLTGGITNPGIVSAFLGPLGAIAGPLAAGLIVGSIFLGKAAQRKKDEEASGQFLTQALQGIEQLAAGVRSGQIDGGQAKAIFETQILGQFIQQINTLKTESVRKSRLTNQVADLRRVFQDSIGPALAAQSARSANALAFGRQIPEFATGGTTRGGLALLHPGEKVLNLQQQSAIRAMAGPNAFERAGVPNANQNRIFDVGGTMPSGGGIPIEINLEAQVVIGKGDATRIVITGASTPQGRAVTVNNIKVARTNREL